MFDTLTSHFLAFAALALPTATLLAWTHRAQARVVALLPPVADALPPTSAMWSLLAMGLVGIIYGMDWPHDVTVAVGGLLFASGWYGRNYQLRFYLTGLFAGSLVFDVPVGISHLSIDTFGDPTVLVATMVAIFSTALLFHFFPKRAATQPTDPVGLHWRSAAAFSALLLGASLIAVRWPSASPMRLGFLAQAPLGVGLGIGFCFVLQCAAAVEIWYRRLSPRARDEYALYVVAALVALALAIVGLQLRLSGPALWIAHLATAGILVSSRAIDPIPPILTLHKPKVEANPSLG